MDDPNWAHFDGNDARLIGESQPLQLSVSTPGQWDYVIVNVHDQTRSLAIALTKAETERLRDHLNQVMPPPAKDKAGR